jgi:hypothetical protein
MDPAQNDRAERFCSSLTRRTFLSSSGAIGLLALAPPARLESLLASAEAATKPRFLTAAELTTLTALCDRLIPGQPEDPTPGAVQAGVPNAIDLLLGAFELDPPLIHAGGPFSSRAGSKRDDFAHFVPMDRQAELGWRIRLEGSKGMPEREFAGPVKGLQEVYRDGLAVLDQRARARGQSGFAAAPTSVREAILADQKDEPVQTFLGAALANTLEAMYGPPEYGGNRGLVGWSSNGWAGDDQPRGFTRAQVTEPETGSVAPLIKAAGDLQLPSLAGRPAPRGEWWLARRRMGR